MYRDPIVWPKFGSRDRCKDPEHHEVSPQAVDSKEKLQTYRRIQEQSSRGRLPTQMRLMKLEAVVELRLSLKETVASEEGTRLGPTDLASAIEEELEE
jgi:hypothetical protein